jgi:chromosome segregation ATPase
MTAQPQPRDLLDRLMSHGVQGAVRVLHLPTPAEQVEQFLNTPGITPNEAEFAKNWQLNEERRRAGEQGAMIKEKKQANSDNIESVDERLGEHTQRSNALYEKATKGDYASVSELSDELKTLHSELRALDSLIEGVEQREQNIAAIEADPAAYVESFYRRFYPLADRLPRLSDALDEFREQKKK